MCAGCRAFFTHVDHPTRVMADLLRRGRSGDGVMTVLTAERTTAFGRAGRYDRCPCGSGTCNAVPHRSRAIGVE